MICRGGIVLESARPTGGLNAPFANSKDSHRDWPGIPWCRALAGVIIVGAGLAVLPGHGTVPPLIESDYCYQLIAAERASQGLGFTSLQPIAPRQPWEWEYDFGFLTQWPVGYSFLVWAGRCLGLSTIESCRWICVWSCAAGLVGWYLWLRQAVPRGWSGCLLSLFGATLALGADSLVNPSTDTLVAALVPWTLLFALYALHQAEYDRRNGMGSGCSLVRLVVAGMSCGGLIWFRYAAIFLPAGMAIYVATASTWRRIAWRHTIALILGASIPIVLLLWLNKMYGSQQSALSRLNLGHRIGFDFSWGHIVAAWTHFTDPGRFGGPKALSVIWRIAPLFVVPLACGIGSLRNVYVSLARRHVFGLSVAPAMMLVLMLVSATTLFSAKYNYVELPRYYLPVRPLYLVLFLAPLVAEKIPRLAITAVMLASLIGNARVERYESLAVKMGAVAEVTAFGQRAVAFAPGAEKVYEWVKNRVGPDTIVFSNFHDFIALETGIPAVPMPTSTETLARWVSRIAAARGIAEPRLVFVLDRHNRWRDYFLPSAEVVIATLELNRWSATEIGSALIFDSNVLDGIHACARALPVN